MNRATGEVFRVPVDSVTETVSGANKITTTVFVDRPSLSRKAAAGYAAAGAGITEVVHQLIRLFQ